MKTGLMLLCFFSLTGKASTVGYIADNMPDQRCKNINLESTKVLSSVACLQGNVYRLEYDQKSKRVMLSFDGKTFSLQQIPKERDPALVGTEKLIGFLADKLQVYKISKTLLYTSSSRTNAGPGGGQCGSGSEIYLNFLDLNGSKPHVKSKILIGSCNYSIELDEQDAFEGKIGDIAVDGDKLLLRFLNYKEIDGTPTATIASDTKSLLFK